MIPIFLKSLKEPFFLAKTLPDRMLDQALYLKSKRPNQEIISKILSHSRSKDLASSIGSRNPLGSRDDVNNRHLLNVTDLEKSSTKQDILSTMTNISASQDPASQLEKLSKRLMNSNFSPLHASLLTTSPDSHQNTPMALSETQAFFLYSTLNGLLNDYDNRGNTIQNLVNQLSRGARGEGKEVSQCSPFM